MPIKKDLSTLPASGTSQAGRRPDAHPRFAPLLAAAWQQSYIESGEDYLPMADPLARWRHSWAANCARAMQYRIQRYAKLREIMGDERVTAIKNGLDLSTVLLSLSTEERQAIENLQVTEPTTIASHWSFNLGHLVHDALQSQIERAFADAEREVKVAVSSRTGGAGTIDLVVRQRTDEIARTGPTQDANGERITEEWVSSIEIKTINGFGFKRMIGDRGTPEGPRFSSVVQAALNAEAIDADECVLIVLALENLSPAVFDKMMDQLGQEPTAADEWRRFCAEYSYTREEYMPIAEAEHKRVARILEITDDNLLAPRAIPDPQIPKGARINDPGRGKWVVVRKDEEKDVDVIVATGTTWHCDYCENRSRCIDDGPS